MPSRPVLSSGAPSWSAAPSMRSTSAASEGSGDGALPSGAEVSVRESSLSLPTCRLRTPPVTTQVDVRRDRMVGGNGHGHVLVPERQEHQGICLRGARQEAAEKGSFRLRSLCVGGSLRQRVDKLACVFETLGVRGCMRKFSNATHCGSSSQGWSACEAGRSSRLVAGTSEQQA